MPVHVVGAVVRADIAEDVEIQSANGVLNQSLAFAVAEARAGCAHEEVLATHTRRCGHIARQFLPCTCATSAATCSPCRPCPPCRAWQSSPAEQQASSERIPHSRYSQSPSQTINLIPSCVISGRMCGAAKGASHFAQIPWNRPFHSLLYSIFSHYAKGFYKKNERNLAS